MIQGKKTDRGKRFTVYTTFFDLVRTVNQFTDDDSLVIAAVSHLVNSCRTRTVGSSVLLKVVPAVVPSANRSGSWQRNNRRSSSCQFSVI